MTEPDSEETMQLPNAGRRRTDFGIVEFMKLVATIWAAMAPLLMGAVVWVKSIDQASMMVHEKWERENYLRRAEYDADRVRAEAAIESIRQARERDHELLVRIADKVGATR